MTEFNFGTASALPSTVRRRGTGRAPSPFEAPLLATLDTGEWATVAVPEDDAKKVSQRIRAVGVKQEVRVSIRQTEPENGNVTVFFKAESRPDNTADETGKLAKAAADAAHAAEEATHAAEEATKAVVESVKPAAKPRTRRPSRAKAAK